MMGAYAMFRNILLRNDNNIKSGLEYTVLPNFLKFLDSYVATMISKSTRKSLISKMSNEVKKDQNNLPLPPDQSDMIEEWSKLFSPKSILKGGVNAISIHEIISLLQVCAHTGKSTGTTLDSYLGSLNPLTGFPVSHSLHGNK